MSNFNIGTINNATISLGNGEQYNVKKMSVSVDGKILIVDKEVSMKVENGILVIHSK